MNTCKDRLSIAAALFVAFSFLGAGCTDQKSTDTPDERAFNERIDKRIKEAHARDVPTTPIGISCADHRLPSDPGGIGDFAVEEVWYGQITKKFVGGMRCGGLVHAGYLLPDKWQPHMKVLVRWRPGWAEDFDNYYIERYTTIPYYNEPTNLHVHFFSKDRVRVVVAGVFPEGESHPIHFTATEPPPEVDGELEQPPNPPIPPKAPKSN